MKSTKNYKEKVFFGGDLINGPTSVATALNDSNDVLNKILELENN